MRLLERTGVPGGCGKPREDLAFSVLVDRWLASLTVLPSTSLDYGNTCRRHLVKHFGKKRVASIRPEHIAAFIASEGRRYSPAM